MDFLGQDLYFPWIIVAMVAVIWIWAVFRMAPMRSGGGGLDTGCLMDVALIFSVVLVLVLLCSQLGPRLTHESFADATPPVSNEDDAWVRTLSTSSQLVSYVSAFQTKSYPGTHAANVWQDVAGGARAEGAGVASTCQPANMDFTFSTGHPSWTAGLGFSLANSVLIGPLSMNVLKTTRAYTVFCLFQVTGLPSNGRAVRMLSIPANGSPRQNGVTIDLSAIGAATGSSIKAHVQLTVGNQPPMMCSDNSVDDASGDQTVAFDTNARYLLSITRSSVNVRVSLFHVESSSARCLPNTLLNAKIVDDALVYNNQPVVINTNGSDVGGGILGNIMCFGIFDGALDPQDEALMCVHYHDLLLLQDPVVMLARSTAATATAKLACPYDKATCTACASVTSWTNPFEIANGGPACTAAINLFCKQNPTHKGCECYNPDAAKLTETTRKTCQALTSAYSGDDNTYCAGAVQQALSAANATAEALALHKKKELDQQQHKMRELNLERREREAASHGSHGSPDGSSTCTAHAQVPSNSDQSFFAWLFGL